MKKPKKPKYTLQGFQEVERKVRDLESIKLKDPSYEMPTLDLMDFHPNPEQKAPK